MTTLEPQTVPAGQFAAEVSDHQLLVLPFVAATMTLCGYSYSQLAPPAVLRTRPCG